VAIHPLPFDELNQLVPGNSKSKSSLQDQNPAFSILEKRNKIQKYLLFPIILIILFSILQFNFLHTKAFKGRNFLSDGRAILDNITSDKNILYQRLTIADFHLIKSFLVNLRVKLEKTSTMIL